MYSSSSSSSQKSADPEDKKHKRTKKTFKEKVTDSDLCPFKLELSLGINSKVPLINLTTGNRTLIAYACSHAVMLYDYVSKETLPLLGHQNAVTTLSISKDGKWLMTADFGEDSVVVVWDTENGVPICTLFNPHGDKGMSAARISPNAKYIVTVGNENHQKVQLWLWTYGRDIPDASIELTEVVSDRVKEISFNEEIPEQFALTTDHSVIFFSWEHDELKYYSPKVIGKSRRLGTFNCSCYLPTSHRVLTATAHGFVLVWATVRERKLVGSKISNEDKKHCKSVRLQKSSITVMLHCNGMIVTGNSEGRINFYDSQLKILYWCKNGGLDSIQSISFDLQSGLTCPISAIIATESDLVVDEEYCSEATEEFDEEEEAEESSIESIYFKGTADRTKNVRSMQHQGKESSILSVNIEPAIRNHGKNRSLANFVKPLQPPTDATLEAAPFNVGNFFVCTSTGIVALMDIGKLKCYFIFKDLGIPITSLDAHPENNHIVTGNNQGLISLFNYHERSIVVSKKAPALPDFRSILDYQTETDRISYVTCPWNHEDLTAVTSLKFSPRCDMLVCGLENGAMWILHPVSLVPLDKLPYKHSSESIVNLTFSKCAEYLAYSDNELVVAVFKRNEQPTEDKNLWNFIGKYRSHYMTIRDILFGSSISDNSTPRFFSLGEDQDLIEYDLENSGPYPDPGLKILQINRIEYSATPLCMAWYPQLGVESFLMISNSEYKYRLLNDMTKMIRETFLGPTFGAPVEYFQMLPTTEFRNGTYMVFATDKEIGLQLLPLDGNPYKIVGIIGHPRKIINVCASHDGNTLFTLGYNDSCVLMWNIRRKSVDVMARLGGEHLSPFYCLIEGGKNGWLINEMRDLFYYAQILHQGENTTATRIVSDKVVVKQIPNLMRAIGYYPSNEELEIILSEVSYKHYAETGQMVDEITFEEFAKLYINHRPAFGHSVRQMKEAFQAFQPSNLQATMDKENPTLTRKQFLDILFGKGPEEYPRDSNRLFGEPFTVQEAYLYMKLLVSTEDNLDDVYVETNEKKLSSIDLNFLPERISYKDFTTDIMGIELPEETRADNE